MSGCKHIRNNKWELCQPGTGADYWWWWAQNERPTSKYRARQVISPGKRPISWASVFRAHHQKKISPHTDAHAEDNSSSAFYGFATITCLFWRRSRNVHYWILRHGMQCIGSTLHINSQRHLAKIWNPACDSAEIAPRPVGQGSIPVHIWFGVLSKRRGAYSAAERGQDQDIRLQKSIIIQPLVPNSVALKSD